MPDTGFRGDGSIDRGVAGRTAKRGGGAGRLFYVRARHDDDRPIEIGRRAHFPVRADLVHAGVHAGMTNQVEGGCVAAEFPGSLETGVFEVSKGVLVHVEQHRSASDRSCEMGDRETIGWSAEAAVLLD